ncbi:MAG: carbohydrate ABC transporter permease, partial [Spirochaetota bacterium]
MASIKTRLYKIPIHIILIVYAIVSIFPLYYVVITTFKSRDEFYTNYYAPPKDWTLEGVIALYKDYGFGRSTLNSVIVTFLSIVITLIIATPSAYAYSKMKFIGRSFLLSLTVALLGVPVMIVIIPVYVVMSKVHLLDSYIGVSFVYAAFNLPFFIFLLTSFFRSIPQALLDAGRIDGCNRFALLIKIIVPLSRPVYTTLTVISTIWVWNELLIAMMFLRKDSMHTITVALSRIVGRYSTHPEMIQAGAFFVALPMIILFLAGRKFFIQGLLSGAL